MQSTVNSFVHAFGPFGFGDAVLVALLVLAAVLDVRTLRIPNWLTLTGFAAAVLFHLSGAAGALGWWAPLSGAALALALLLPLWMLRVMGAGDVKLMGVVGAFLGPAGLVPALLFTCVAAGVLALAWAARRGVIGQLAPNLRFVATCLFASPGRAPSVGSFPYAVGICAGTVAYLAARYAGLF